MEFAKGKVVSALLHQVLTAGTRAFGVIYCSVNVVSLAKKQDYAYVQCLFKTVKETALLATFKIHGSLL